MKKLAGKIVSVHVGPEHGVMLSNLDSIKMKLDGVDGDRYQGFTRETFAGDKQPVGTTRRNERQWSAISQEELEQISKDMKLAEVLTADAAGVNFCVRGIPEFSRLPKGTLLKFPSGAELVVVEYNPPCRGQGRKIAQRYRTKTGEVPAETAFPKAAKLTRGLVGVVDVAGEIRAGDEVIVEIYETPPWLARSGG